jgi:hypothetical protein
MKTTILAIAIGLSLAGAVAEAGNYGPFGGDYIVSRPWGRGVSREVIRRNGRVYTGVSRSVGNGVTLHAYRDRYGRFHRGATYRYRNGARIFRRFP